MVRGEGEEEQVPLLWELLGEGVEERVQVGPREGEGERPLRVVRERRNSTRHGFLSHKTDTTIDLKGQTMLTLSPSAFHHLQHGKLGLGTRLPRGKEKHTLGSASQTIGSYLAVVIYRTKLEEGLVKLITCTDTLCMFRRTSGRVGIS